MVQVEAISSLEGPELAPYRTMRRQMEHRQQGIFVAEGEKVVRRLIESRFTVISVLVPEKWYRDLEPLLQKRPENIRAFVAEKKLLETLTGFSMYQGLLAVGKVPPSPLLHQVLNNRQQPRLIVAVDGLSSAENLGALVRNCAAFNVQALIVGETCTSPYLRRAVRSSMGAIFHLPVIESSDLRQSLEQVKESGVHCLAAHAHAQEVSLPSADLKRECCLVFGSEGYGIRPSVLEVCDEAVTVPMASPIDSLNVANAAAVFLYEVNRQRGRMS